MKNHCNQTTPSIASWPHPRPTNSKCRQKGKQKGREKVKERGDEEHERERESEKEGKKIIKNSSSLLQ